MTFVVLFEAKTLNMTLTKLKTIPLSNAEYKVLFRELYNHILTHEWNNKEPDGKRESDYTELIFNRKCKNGNVLNTYLQQIPIARDKNKISARYFYKRYQVAEGGKPSITVHPEVVFNCLYYLKIKLPHVTDYKNSYSVSNAEVFLSEFRERFRKEIAEEALKGMSQMPPEPPRPITDRDLERKILKLLNAIFGENPGDQIYQIKLNDIMKLIHFESDKRKDLNRDIDFIQNTYSNKSINYLKLGKLFSHYEIIHDYRRNEIPGWGKYKFEGDFELGEVLQEFYPQAILDYEDSLKRGNVEVVRVKDLRHSEATLDLTVQKAKYFQQIASNIIADRKFNPEKFPDSEKLITTIRQWDMHQAGVSNTLPSFTDSKLANTIGVAVAVFTRNAQGQKVFLTRKRSDKTAVYPNSIHLPFTFALTINDFKNLPKEGTIKDLIRPCFEREQIAELGFFDKSFKYIKPIAFCRELIRAGKPQFFFEMEMTESVDELKKKIAENANNQDSKIVFKYISDTIDDNIKLSPSKDAEKEFEEALNHFNTQAISSEFFASMLLAVGNL